MGSFLPKMVYKDGIRKYTQVRFGGYNHRLSAQDGELWDMENLTSDHYPLLAPRKRRYILGQVTDPTGFYAHDGLYWTAGTGFYENGTLKGTVTAGKKRFAVLGACLVILPDKKYYNRLTGEFGNIEASQTANFSIQDGEYAGKPAEGNTIYGPGGNWGSFFKVGDGVEISGCQKHPENNGSYIIREIEGDYLRFYPNSFVVGDTGDFEIGLTVKRKMPDMDFICENENRLWGCKGDEIYCSKLGDLFNWNVFDGIASDSWAVGVHSAGDFTGACSYLGYPVFFKEEHIYKVYGDKPSNFQVMGSASLGVAEGSGDSLAIAGETLFYLSRAGIVSYSGGMPQSISAPFGDQRFHGAVGGSDGVKYYVSMADAENHRHLFVFDTAKKVWHREDDLEIVGFGWNGEFHFLDAGGTLWLWGNARTVPEDAQREEPVESLAEFGDFVENNPNEKGTAKLQLRVELEENASVQVEIQFDSDGEWQPVKELSATVKQSFYLPIIPRRADHCRIRLKGTGDWRLYSLIRESYSGSEL